MKKTLLALTAIVALVASTSPASARSFWGISIGVSAPVAVAPCAYTFAAYPSAPAPLVQVVPACPAPGYTWVAGYWTAGNGVWIWNPGYWVAPAPVVVAPAISVGFGYGHPGYYRYSGYRYSGYWHR